MSVDPANYCVVCGDDMVVVLGDQPLCLTHFSDALKKIRSTFDDRRSNE